MSYTQVRIVSQLLIFKRIKFTPRDFLKESTYAIGFYLLCKNLSVVKTQHSDAVVSWTLLLVTVNDSSLH